MKPQTRLNVERRSIITMPRPKTTPFKTELTEHVHTVLDKGRKVPAIAVLWTADAYSTITHNAYKNKSNDAEFCILFSTLIHHHIDPENQKLVVNEGYSKNDTRVISKNIRHAPKIMEFFQEYEQYGKVEGKQMSMTVFDNPRKQDSSGFLTLTFNGGVEMNDMPGEMKNMQYLHVVNGLSPTTPSSGSSLVKSFPQTEFVFLEEDVDRYIQFIKDVAIYYSYLQEFNREASSAKAVLKSSLLQRLKMMAKKDQTEGAESNKTEKKKKVLEKKTGESSQSSNPPPAVVQINNKKKKISKKRPKESANASEEDPNEKKRKLVASMVEAKKRELIKTTTQQKTGKNNPKKGDIGKTAVTKEVIEIEGESGDRCERGEDGEENVEEYEEDIDAEIVDEDGQEGEGSDESASEGEDEDEESGEN